MNFVQFCRGMSATKDFIDLALLAIHTYESNNREMLCKINDFDVAVECDNKSVLIP